MLRLLLLAIPIVFMPNALHLSFETGVPGANVANVVFLAALAAVLTAHRDQPALPRGILTPALLAYFAVLVVGFFATQFILPLDWRDDATALKNYIFYPLLYFVYRNCRLSAENTRRLIILVMIVAAVAGLEAVREGLDYGFGRFAESRRASGPFGVDYRNANRAGVYYAMFLPMFLAMVLFFRGQKMWRIAAIIGCMVLTLAIMATYSRQAYAIALVSLSLLLVRKNVILALLLAAMTLPIVELLPASVTQRVAETEQTTEAGTQELDVSTASRFEIWEGATSMWTQFPVGVGFRRFGYFIGRYAPSHAGMDAHNYYILTLSELGPVGVAILLWLLWRIWRLSGLVRKQAGRLDPETRALGIGFTVMVAAMLMGNLYGSPFSEGSVMGSFWMLCGLMERYALLRLRGAAEGLTRRADESASSAGAQRFPLASRISPGKYEP